MGIWKVSRLRSLTCDSSTCNASIQRMWHGDSLNRSIHIMLKFFVWIKMILTVFSRRSPKSLSRVKICMFWLGFVVLSKWGTSDICLVWNWLIFQNILSINWKKNCLWGKILPWSSLEIDPNGSFRFLLLLPAETENYFNMRIAIVQSIQNEIYFLV